MSQLIRAVSFASYFVLTSNNKKSTIFTWRNRVVGKSGSAQTLGKPIPRQSKNVKYQEACLTWILAVTTRWLAILPDQSTSNVKEKRSKPVVLLMSSSLAKDAKDANDARITALTIMKSSSGFSQLAKCPLDRNRCFLDLGQALLQSPFKHTLDCQLVLESSTSGC